MKTKKNGFTLTELLVTITILGIVTIMSIPLINSIKEANLKRKYNTFLDSLTYNSKLYVDSYQDDLFKYKDSGCAYISYADLKNKLLTKDIEIDNISCNSDDTFVKVRKLFDMYNYSPTIGCGPVNNNKVEVKINYPQKLTKEENCGADVEKRMIIKITPEKSEAISKKKVNMNVSVSSQTGFNTQSQISYGFYKVDSSHPAKNYNYVEQWYTLSFNIPSKERQMQIFPNLGENESYTITSNDISTPNGGTGKYQLVVRVDFLTDLAGVNWRDDDVSDYIYSSGLYTVDNSKPTFSSFTARSSVDAYRSKTPYIDITATDSDNFTSNDNLLACYSKDSDTCSKKTADIKRWKKLSEINHKTVSELSTDFDSSNHTLYVTVADLAGNYVTKTTTYKVAQRYRINYNANNGRACSPTYKDVVYNNESPGKWGTLCTTTRDYYNFVEWNRKADGTGAKVTADTYCSDSEKTITVYAKWTPINYTISYNLNGGSVSGNPTTYNVETATFTLKNPTKTGYDFKGWTGTGLSGKTMTVTIPKGSHDNRSYTANWEPHIYSISYNLNSGSVSGNPTTYTIESANFTLKNPTRTGYDFQGWTGTGLNSASTSVTIPKGSYGDRSYTATWKAHTYTISYTLNGGSNPGNNATYTIETASFTLKNPTRTGYTFKGWTGSNGTTPQTSVTISKGSTGNKSYTANWQVNTYSISYNYNGGSNPGNNSSYTIETASFTLKNPTRTGYTFKGWTGSNGTTPQTSVTISKGSTGNKSYTANWQVNTYTISYNYNGGSNPGNNSSYTVETASFTLKNPSRTGYTFAGWTGTGLGSASTSVTISKGSTGNRSYTANWNIITYTITYNGNRITYNINSNPITLTNPTKSCYSFKGWTGSNGTTPQTTVTIPKGSTGDKSYTPNWTANTYTITFNANGGGGSTATKTCTYDSNCTLSGNGFSRSGYAFQGWATSAGGGVSYSNGQTVKNLACSGNVNLYAVWQSTGVYRTASAYSYGNTSTLWTSVYVGDYLPERGISPTVSSGSPSCSYSGGYIVCQVTGVSAYDAGSHDECTEAILANGIGLDPHWNDAVLYNGQCWKAAGNSPHDTSGTFNCHSKDSPGLNSKNNSSRKPQSHCPYMSGDNGPYCSEATDCITAGRGSFVGSSGSTYNVCKCYAPTGILAYYRVWVTVGYYTAS